MTELTNQFVKTQEIPKGHSTVIITIAEGGLSLLQN